MNGYVLEALVINATSKNRCYLWGSVVVIGGKECSAFIHVNTAAIYFVPPILIYAQTDVSSTESMKYV